MITRLDARGVQVPGEGKFAPHPRQVFDIPRHPRDQTRAPGISTTALVPGVSAGFGGARRSTGGTQTYGQSHRLVYGQRPTPARVRRRCTRQ